MTVHLSDLISRKEAIDLMMQGVQHEIDKKYEHLDNKFAYHRYLHGECCYRKAAKILEDMTPVSRAGVSDEMLMMYIWEGINDALGTDSGTMTEFAESIYYRIMDKLIKAEIISQEEENEGD